MDELKAKLRTVEAERDDAEYRFLENNDKVSSLRSLMQGFIGDALRAIAAMDGTEEPVIVSRNDYDLLLAYRDDVEAAKAEAAEPIVSGVASNVESQVVPVPLAAQEDGSAPTPSSVETAVSGVTEGQSEVDPTVASPSGNSSQSAPIETAETPSDVLPKTSGEGQSEPQGNVTIEPPSESFPNGLVIHHNVPEGERLGEEAPAAQPPIPPSQPDTTTAHDVSETGSGGIDPAQSGSHVSDDVGYHNEPNTNSREDWYKWCEAMDLKYGYNRWPARA